MTVSIVVPVYHSEATLRDLHGQLSKALPRITPEYEIIFVEDCGGDRSALVHAAGRRPGHD